MYSNGIQSYQKTNITTSDPIRLVILCYEGAIDNLQLAKQKIIEKDYQGKAKAVMQTREIINELLGSLDFEKGGVIARNLFSLYNYIMRRMIQVDINLDTDAIDEISGILKELLSAWEGVYSKPDVEIQPGEESYTTADSTSVSRYVGV